MPGPLVSSTGHVGLRVEAPGLRLLCDPWVSPGGAFLGSWFPAPDNSHLRSVPGLWETEWVAVSSAHADHMDSEFLAGLGDAVQVVIPSYPSSVLRDLLSAAGVKNIVDVEGWQRIPLNDRGDWLTCVPEQSPMSHRAAFLIVANGVSVLHGNDAQVSLSQVRRAMIEVGGPLDLMALDASESRFRAAKRLVRTVKPRLVLPYGRAEPGELPAETVTVLPGDSLRIAPNSHDVIRNTYLEGRAASPTRESADVWDAYPDPGADSGLAERFAEYFVRLVIDETPEDLVLRCLAHNFDFSLKTGLCLNARCEPIVVAATI